MSKPKSMSGRRVSRYTDWGWEPEKVDAGDVSSAPHTRRSLSSFWGERFADWRYSNAGGVSADTYKYVQVLRNLQRVGRIIFGQDAETFTYVPNSLHAEEAVQVDAGPLQAKDLPDWDHAKRVDASMGRALSDAACMRDTKETHYVATRMCDGVEDDYPRLAALYGSARWLYSTRNVRESFPGYGGYFDTSREYLHRESARTSALTGIAEDLDPKLGGASRSIEAALKSIVWNALAPSGASLDTVDADFDQDCHEIADLLKRESLAARTQDALERAARHALEEARKRFVDPPNPKGGSAESASKFAESLGAPSGESVTSASKGTLSDEEIVQIAQMAEEDLEVAALEDQPRLPPRLHTFEGQRIEVATLKAAKDAGRYLDARSSIANLISRTRSSLAFRNEIARMDEYTLTRGLIDEGALARVAEGDFRVFRRQETISAPSAHIGILIDESGSMSGSGERTARACAVLLYEALRGVPGVATSIWGHSANEDGELMRDCVVRRYLERGAGDPHTLGSIRGRDDNLDGAAILWTAHRMHELSRANEHQLLFVLSDGQPAGFVGKASVSYFGHAGNQHTCEAIDHARKSGVQVFGLGMGRAFDATILEALYGARGWVYVPVPADLPRALSKLLTHALRTGRL